MPVQRRKLSAWLQSGLKRKGPSLNQLHNQMDIAKRQRAYSRWENHLARHGHPRGSKWTKAAKQGGGGGSRSEAARKAWRTRRGH